MTKRRRNLSHTYKYMHIQMFRKIYCICDKSVLHTSFRMYNSSIIKNKQSWFLKEFDNKRLQKYTSFQHKKSGQ